MVRTPFTDYKPSYVIKKKNSYLSHCILGNSAYSRTSPKKNTLLLISNLLGGPALNSRLNMVIREKYGYAYSIESMYQPYSDSGIFNIYIGADKEYVEKSISLVKKELSIDSTILARKIVN